MPKSVILLMLAKKSYHCIRYALICCATRCASVASTNTSAIPVDVCNT